MILCIPVTSSILCQTGTCMKITPDAGWKCRCLGPSRGRSDWVDLALDPHMYLQLARCM